MKVARHHEGEPDQSQVVAFGLGLPSLSELGTVVGRGEEGEEVRGVVQQHVGAEVNKTYGFPPSNLTIPTDVVSIARGQHIAETLCEGCHGTDLSGINNWFEDGALGTIDGANLTLGQGGVGQTYTDEEFVRAVRHGIDQDGKPTFMIAVVSTAYLSDEDLAAVIAYVKSVPPVDHITYGKQFTPLAKILLAAGLLLPFPAEVVSHETHVTAPAQDVTAEYGSYLVDTHDCRICHGQTMNGNKFPDPTQNIIDTQPYKRRRT